METAEPPLNPPLKFPRVRYMFKFVTNIKLRTHNSFVGVACVSEHGIRFLESEMAVLGCPDSGIAECGVQGCTREVRSPGMRSPGLYT